MKPYYEQDGITLFCGDCREVMAQQCVQEYGPFAALVTDPPYGVGKAMWDHYPEGSLEQAWDLVDGAAFVCWSAFDLNGPAATFSGCLKNTIVWWKPNLPALHMWDRGRLASQWEPVFYHAREGFEPAERPTDVWAFGYPSNGANRLHPTQKPIALMRRILRLVGRGPILDPFAGSGTTLEAARDAGLRAVGIEGDIVFCRVIADRLSQSVLPLADRLAERQP